MSGNTETEFVSVHEAIARAKAECNPVGKGDWNEQQRFKFRGVDAVVNGAAKALNKYGVIITPTVKLKKIEKRTYQSKNGSTMLHVLVPVVYRLFGADGSGPVVVKVVGEAADAGDKVVSKATSVAYRIMLLQVLNLPTGDPDPDSESHERESARAGGDPWGNGKRGGNRRQQAPQGGGEDWRNLPPVNRPRRGDGSGHPAPQPARQADGPQVPPRPAADDDLGLAAWGAKIDEITDMVSAKAVRDELDASGLSDEHKTAISGSIDAKLNLLNGGQRPRPQRPKGPPAEERGAVAVPTGKGDDGEWVQGFLKRLDAVTDPDVLGEFQRQIGSAVKAKTITPAKSVDLTAAIRNHRNKLQAVPA